MAFQKIRRLNFNPDGWLVKDIPQESRIGFDFTACRTGRNTNRHFVGRDQREGDKNNMSGRIFESQPSRRAADW